MLPAVWIAGDALHDLLGKRRPFLTAKRLLTNQTFRDIYRTDTLDVDQRLKITSLTFLFTDLKGSTELYERVGDLVAFDLVRAHFRVLNEIVAAEAGAVVKTIGDAVMATFPTPDRAVAAALRMREAMRRLNDERGREDLLLKIGIHEGPCLAVTLNDRQDYFGQTVNIASRVQGLAIVARDLRDRVRGRASRLQRPDRVPRAASDLPRRRPARNCRPHGRVRARLGGQASRKVAFAAASHTCYRHRTMPLFPSAFARTTLTLLIASAIALLAIVGTSLWLVERTGTHSAEVARAQELRLRAFRVLGLLQDAETGQRGYLLTGEAAYLEPYDRAKDQIRTDLARLREAAGAADTGAERIDRLTALVDDKFAELAETVALTAAGRTDEALTIVRSDRGKALMDEARTVVSAIIADSDARLNARLADLQWSALLLRWVSMGGGLLIIVFAAGCTFTVMRHTRALAVARHQVDALNAGLEDRVDERTADLQPRQRGDPALRLHRQPRSARAAGQHHGLHQRARNGHAAVCSAISTRRRRPKSGPRRGGAGGRPTRTCPRRSASSAPRPTRWTG